MSAKQRFDCDGGGSVGVDSLENILEATGLGSSKKTAIECSGKTACGAAEWCVLDGRGRDEMAKSRIRMTYRRGENVFHQGEKSQGIYCIEKGSVLLRRYDGHGNETTFRISGAGETIGWRSYFAGESHQATALVLEEVRLCFIPGNTVNGLIDRYPELGRKFLRTLASDSGPKIALLTRNPYLPVLTRLANFLWLMIRATGKEPDGGTIRIRLPLKRSQIAGMLATRGETLSRAIADLRDEKIAEFNGRDVVILDLSRLESMVRS